MRRCFAIVTLGLVLGCEESKLTPTVSSGKPAIPTTAPAAKPPAPTLEGRASPSAEPNLEEGRRLYMTGCANCHGPDGSGSLMRQMMPQIGDLTSAELHQRMSDEEIAALVMQGRGKMPAFGNVFNAEQIRSVIAYVRTLKK